MKPPRPTTTIHAAANTPWQAGPPLWAASSFYITYMHRLAGGCYCRPAACLREMGSVLKPGGILVIEDGDIASAASIPPTALNEFAELFTRLGPVRGLNYSLANNLQSTLAEMKAAADDPDVLVLSPRMSVVWARKAA